MNVLRYSQERPSKGLMSVDASACRMSWGTRFRSNSSSSEGLHHQVSMPTLLRQSILCPVRIKKKAQAVGTVLSWRSFVLSLFLIEAGEGVPTTR